MTQYNAGDLYNAALQYDGAASETCGYNNGNAYNAPIGYEAATCPVGGARVLQVLPGLLALLGRSVGLSAQQMAVAAGGKRRPKIQTYPNWTPAPTPIHIRRPVEEEEALLLCGAI